MTPEELATRRAEAAADHATRAWPEHGVVDHCTCDCGAEFQSVCALVAIGDGDMGVSQNPCPSCGGHRLRAVISADREQPSAIDELAEVITEVNAKVTVSEHCRTGLVGALCRCWRCRREDGPAPDERAAARDAALIDAAAEAARALDRALRGPIR